MKLKISNEGVKQDENCEGCEEAVCFDCDDDCNECTIFEDDDKEEEINPALN